MLLITILFELTIPACAGLRVYKPTCPCAKIHIIFILQVGNTPVSLIAKLQMKCDEYRKQFRTQSDTNGPKIGLPSISWIQLSLAIHAGYCTCIE